MVGKSVFHVLFLSFQDAKRVSLAGLETEHVFRLIDANLNRLREALRVIEEHVRFVSPSPPLCIELKKMRHSLEDVESSFGRLDLLRNRDTHTDPFADKNRPEELRRESYADVLIANFKRAEEAARVIEEYSKITARPECSETAKTIRFALYSCEKSVFLE
jgi:hypothetical protein